MRENKQALVIGLLLTSIITLMIITLPVIGQGTVAQLFITGSDDSSAPTVRLHVYAVDSQGNPVALDEGSIVVRHDGAEASNVSIANPYEAGIFTIFILDIPQGVAAHIPTIQDSIRQYASDPTMKEQVDSVAIFAVDELAASQILEPDSFYNSVANAFASPLAPRTGATALVDSVMGLLNNVAALKPNPDMVTHMVLMSDGTDVVSTQFEASAVPRTAAELGIQIHTVILDNQSLSSGEKETGREYLSQIAAGTRGISTTLSTIEDLQPIWNRISAFRNQTTIQYSVDNALGGDYVAEVSLRDNPAITAETTVTFPPGAPSVSINLPPESRSMTLPNLDQPLNLSFGAVVSWLDGAEREISTAQLLVNGIAVQEIDPNNLDQFDATINNFQYGPNQVQVAVVDDQGSRATSPEITITIEQGETVIPEEVAPSSLPEKIWQRISGAALFVGGCFLVVFLLLLIVGITIAGQRSSLVRRLGLVSLMRRIPFLRSYFSDAYQARGQLRRAERGQQQLRRYSSDVKGSRSKPGGATRPIAFLEVIASNTALPSRIDLEDVEAHLGRSASQANVVFKNDATVSRIHATITQEGQDYRIYDEQSTSGTWVNEQRVPEYGLQLVDGDEIRLGAVRLRFRQP
ncbi:MAG: FHA domain-containing protein [Chloroflexota bacterium]